MKKHTLVAKLQEDLAREVRVADLKLVGGGKITIVGTGSNVTAVSGDADV
jgi:hypothetical protein